MAKSIWKEATNSILGQKYNFLQKICLCKWGVPTFFGGNNYTVFDHFPCFTRRWYRQICDNYEVWYLVVSYQCFMLAFWISDWYFIATEISSFKMVSVLNPFALHGLFFSTSATKTPWNKLQRTIYLKFALKLNI